MIQVAMNTSTAIVELAGTNWHSIMIKLGFLQPSLFVARSLLTRVPVGLVVDNSLFSRIHPQIPGSVTYYLQTLSPALCDDATTTARPPPRLLSLRDDNGMASESPPVT